jgi:hypothetical protein
MLAAIRLEKIKGDNIRVFMCKDGGVLSNETVNPDFLGSGGLVMKLSAAALTVMLATGISTQALSQTLTTVMGFPDSTCGTWTQARTNHQSQGMEYWVDGFASGADGVLSQSGFPDFLKNVEGGNALFSWIDSAR